MDLAWDHTIASAREAPMFADLAENASADNRLDLLSLLAERGPESIENKTTQIEVERFEKKHGVEVKQLDGKFSFHLRNSDRVLFHADANKQGLDREEKKLDALRDDLQGQLERKYKVTFAQAGEFIEKQRSSAESKQLGKDVHSRPAQYFELVGIAAALEKVGASAVTKDKTNGVKIYFPDDKLISELDSMATYQRDKNDRPSIYLYQNKIEYATEEDLPQQLRNLAATDTERPETLEGALIHEYGHHQLDKLGLAEKQSKEALFNAMGWVYSEKMDEWLLQGRSKDQDGNPSTYRFLSSGLFSTWDRWSLDKGPINAQGQKVPAGEHQKLTEAQMRAEAAVTPFSWYFQNPEETYAEAFRYYKLNSASKEELKRVSPRLYELVDFNSKSE